MDEILKKPWPVDRLVLIYFVFAVILELIYWKPLLIVAHAAAVALLFWAIRSDWKIFRHWYPLLYVAGCYKEMSILIPAIRSWDADAFLADLDFRIWGAHPTVWLERWQFPLGVEIFQAIYSTFIPAIALIGYLLWRKERFEDFRRYAFMMTLGFLASYIGYLLVPARGPRFLLAGLQTRELQGLWISGALRGLLDRLEAAHYDCFPSGHVEMTFLVFWNSRLISRNLAYAMFVYLLCVAFATIYLRYHYTVDVGAGVLLACTLIPISPRLYTLLSEKAA